MALVWGKRARLVGDVVVVEEHLYLTEDRTRVVSEGDPACRWLWAAPGDERPRAEAERLGVVKPEAPVEEPAEEPKRRQPAANKMRSRPVDK